jgi:hypothetical protein
MIKRAAQVRALVYEGVMGLCPCCTNPTEIRLGSTGGVPEEESWIVPETILFSIYSDVASRIKSKVEDGKVVYYVLDPSENFATVRNKLFFIGGDGAELAGPFGYEGLKVFLKTRLENTRERIYIVNTTSRALSMIRNSPFATNVLEPLAELKASDLF